MMKIKFLYTFLLIQIMVSQNINISSSFLGNQKPFDSEQIMHVSNINANYEYLVSKRLSVSFGVNYIEINRNPFTTYFFDKLFFHQRKTLEFPVFLIIKSHHSEYQIFPYFDFGAGYALSVLIEYKNNFTSQLKEDLKRENYNNRANNTFGNNILVFLETGLDFYNINFGTGIIMRYDLDGTYAKKNVVFGQIYVKFGVSI